MQACVCTLQAVAVMGLKVVTAASEDVEATTHLLCCYSEQVNTQLFSICASGNAPHALCDVSTNDSEI